MIGITVFDIMAIESPVPGHWTGYLEKWNRGSRSFLLVLDLVLHGGRYSLKY